MANSCNKKLVFFDATQSGELISRLGSDTTVVKQAIATSWAEVVLGMVKLSIAIGLMVSISPSLASLTVTSTVVIFVLCIPFGRLLGKLSKEFQDKLGQAQSWPTEILGAMRTVQSFVAEEKEAHRYASLIGTNLVMLFVVVPNGVQRVLGGKFPSDCGGTSRLLSIRLFPKFSKNVKIISFKFLLI